MQHTANSSSTEREETIFQSSLVSVEEICDKVLLPSLLLQLFLHLHVFIALGAGLRTRIPRVLGKAPDNTVAPVLTSQQCEK